MNFKGGDFSTGEMGNFHPALTGFSKHTENNPLVIIKEPV